MTDTERAIDSIVLPSRQREQKTSSLLLTNALRHPFQAPLLFRCIMHLEIGKDIIHMLRDLTLRCQGQHHIARRIDDIAVTFSIVNIARDETLHQLIVIGSGYPRVVDPINRHRFFERHGKDDPPHATRRHIARNDRLSCLVNIFDGRLEAVRLPLAATIRHKIACLIEEIEISVHPLASLPEKHLPLLIRPVFRR